MAGSGLQESGLLRARPGIDHAEQVEAFEHGLELLVVDVRDDLHVDRRAPQRRQRLQAVGPQHGLFDGGPVLAIDGLVGGGLVDRPAEGGGGSGKGGAEQGAMRVGGLHRHVPVGHPHALAVGGPERPVGDLDAGRPRHEPQLAEVRVAQGPIVEQGAGEVEEDGLHDTPARARSSAHFRSADGRRLGRCSVGHPSTGV